MRRRTVISQRSLVDVIIIKSIKQQENQQMYTLTRIVLITALAALTACGGGGGGGGSDAPRLVIEPPCVPVPIEYTYSSTAIYIEPTNDSCLTPQEIEILYYETLACVGVTVPISPARIEFISFVGTGRPGSSLGQYQQLIQQVWINKDRVKTAGLSRYALSHEFVHHALYFLGATPEDNHEHGSPAFDDCART